jgi:hypothetical protein
MMLPYAAGRNVRKAAIHARSTIAVQIDDNRRLQEPDDSSELVVKATFAALAASSLAACSTATLEPPARPEAARSGPNATAAISIADVLGQWDVVSFEGYKPVRMHGAIRAAIADFDGQSVSLRIECNSSIVEKPTVKLSGSPARRRGMAPKEMGAGIAASPHCAERRICRSQRHIPKNTSSKSWLTSSGVASHQTAPS